jgi:aldose 1-epimerase
MPIEKKSFGLLASGDEVSLFILRAGDYRATLSDFGATLVSLFLPDGRGGEVDVVLGFGTLEGYTKNLPFFGSTVGRFANRIGGAAFALGGIKYELAANDGPNHLHGGIRGFDKRVWEALAFEETGQPCVQFARTSPDGEEGYPGELRVAATFRLRFDGSLEIGYSARTQARTIVNLTNHAYFNLCGEGSGSVLNHRLRLACSRYLPAGPDHLPTGEIASVTDGAFDFLEPKSIGRDIEAAGGYDHCFVIDRTGPGMAPFAEIVEPSSGRRMTAETSMPGVQFYTGNFLEAVAGKPGSLYGKHGGLCLETQFFPDSPNRPGFPSVVLVPGEEWERRTIFRFFP